MDDGMYYLVWDDDYGMSIHGTSEFLFSME